jgi:iron(III) transport system permease protein
MRVTLPMISPSLLAVFLLCFVLSLENFGVLAVLGLPSQIPFVSTELYVRLTYYPPDYGYATVVAISLILVTTFGLWLQTRVLKSSDYVAISGRGYRDARVPLKGLKPWAFALVLLFVFISVILPFAVLVVASLQPYWSVGFAPFTLNNYALMFSRQNFAKALGNTLVTSVIGAVLTTMLALAIAYLVQRTRAPARNAVDFLAMLPISIPGAALGVGLLWAWIVVPLPIFGTLLIIVFAFIAKFLPLGVRNISAALTQVGPDLEAAARLAGASRLKAVTTVTLPLVRDSIFSSWVLLFVSMVKEVNTTILLYSVSTILLPIMIFDAREDGNFPRVAALSCGLTFVLLILVGIAQKVFNSRMETMDRT